MAISVVRVAVHTASADLLYDSTAAAAVRNPFRVRIKNAGPNILYIGPTNGVTSATGYPLAASMAAGSEIVFERDEIQDLVVYGRCATADQASPADTAVEVETRG